MEKEGAPFPSGGAVGVGATEELDFAVECFNEARIAEGGDGFAFVPDERSESVQFHASIFAGRVGQRRGEGQGKCKMKNGGAKPKRRRKA